MRRTVLVALALLGALRTSQAQAPSQSTARVTAQVAIGTVLTPVGFIGAGWATKHLGRRAGWNDSTASRNAYIAAWTGAWLTAASGPIIAGRDGKPLAALGGSLAGIGAGLLTARLGNALWDDDRRDCGVGCWTVGLVTMALPSIGATAAYAASRR